jgi:hypothetical protein
MGQSHPLRVRDSHQVVAVAKDIPTSRMYRGNASAEYVNGTGPSTGLNIIKRWVGGIRQNKRSNYSRVEHTEEINAEGNRADTSLRMRPLVDVECKTSDQQTGCHARERR